MQIWTKRVYEEPGRQEGVRILVDRIWPRGVSKEEALIDHWLKDIAPSTELRKWFNHDPRKWEKFKEKYFLELNGNGELLEELLRIAHMGPVTLVYGARDQDHNNAVALKEFLEKQA
jgi:uncharacterized protein YeaO (DUF488 family)